MLVTARVPKTTAMMRGTIINATRLRWSVEAIFSIERSSLWRRRWADFDWNAAQSFVAQDIRTSPAPEAVGGPAGYRIDAICAPRHPRYRSGVRDNIDSWPTKGALNRWETSAARSA